MNVLIIGASWYIGTSVARVVQDAGHNVIGLARSDASETTLRQAGYRVLRGDVNDHASLVRGIDAADAVIHLGAVQGNRGAAAEDVAAVKVMVDTLRGSGKRFILTTSMGVFGLAKGLVDEGTPYAPPPAQAWRPEIERLAMGERVDGMVVRPSLVYGRGRASQVLLRLMDNVRQAGVARYVGDGTQLTSFVHVDDIARLYLLALEEGSAGAGYNAVSQQVSAKDLARAIASAVGLSRQPEPVSGEAAGAGTPGLISGGTSVVSSLTTARLGWSPSGPTVLFELLHGSLSALPHRSP